jgi:hypothetical protein
MSAPEFFGKITCFAGSGKKSTGEYDARVDRLAATAEGQLMLASIVCPTMTFKGFRAALSQDNLDASFQVDGLVMRRPGEDRTYHPRGRAQKAPGGYRFEVHRLPFGMCHALLIAKTSGFLPAATEGHLWRELMGLRYTTPLLRGWLPYILAKLREAELLRYCISYRCESAVLTAGNEDLDTIVSEGVRSGALVISRAMEHPAPGQDAITEERDAA